MAQNATVTLLNRDIEASHIRRLDRECRILDIQKCTSEDWQGVWETIAQMKQLVQLTIGDCPLGDLMMQYVARLPKLSKLTIVRTCISTHGIFCLLEQKELKELVVGKTVFMQINTIS